MDIPRELAEHMARVWRCAIPYDGDLIVGDEKGIRWMQGDWFLGNMEKEKAP